MDEAQPSSSTHDSRPPKCYLLACNPRKSTNLGPLIRCASAFGVHQIVLAGYAKCSTSGAHGAQKHVNITSFPTMEQAVQYLKLPPEHGGGGCSEVIGILNGFGQYKYSNNSSDMLCEDPVLLPVVHNKERNCLLPSSDDTDPEITKVSCSIHERKFSLDKNTCFFLSLSARTGISIDQGKYCDSFVHIPHHFIPQPELEATSSCCTYLLNVETCVSIVLHYFASFVRYDERMFQGQKFEVNKKSNHQRIDESVDEGSSKDQQIHSSFHVTSEQRQEKKRALKQEAEQTLDDFGNYLFSIEDACS